MIRLLRTVMAAALLAAAASACSGSALKAAGEPCVASSECEQGLACDFGQDPPVCAGMTTGDGDGD